MALDFVSGYIAINWNVQLAEYSDFFPIIQLRIEGERWSS